MTGALGAARRAPLDETTLATIADGIAAGNPAAFVPPGATRRWGCVASTQSYAAWVISWPAGTGLAMHDHDGSHAAVRVVAGRLRERFVTAGAVHTRWLAPGSCTVLPAEHVHEMINLGDEEALTVHVYSPPIADMTFRIDPEIDLRSGDVASGA